MPSIINQKAVMKNIRETEIWIASFVIEHSIPINVSDHLVRLINSIQLEPKYLEKLKCNRTKCTAIINNVIATTGFEDLVNYLKTNKFSLLVDESTDISSVKNLAIVVRICQNLEVTDQFLNLLPVANATADSMYEAIIHFFNSHEIPYQTNLIGFDADGANAMMGKNHSSQSLLKNDVPELLVMKYVCHSLALCAEYGCGKLPDEVEMLIRNIYNFNFNHSYKRQHEFKEFQEFLNVKPHKLLQLSCTRWLSLLMVVKRVLEQYVPLKLYSGLQMADGINNSQTICESLNNPIYKMYLEFLEFILPTLVNFNLEFQSATPKVYLLHSRLIDAHIFILQCYIKPEVLLHTEVEKLQYRNPINFLPNDEIYIGPKVAVSLTQNVINANQLSSFRTNCLNFYITCAFEMYKRFPFNSSKIIALKQLSFLDPKNMDKFPSLGNISLHFPKFYTDIYALDIEWRMLKASNDLDISLNVFEFWKKHLSLTK